MPRKYTTDYYTVTAGPFGDIPDDMFEKDRETDGMLDYAIEIARERARLYVVPCNWEAWFLPNRNIRVKRIQPRMGG